MKYLLKIDWVVYLVALVIAIFELFAAWGSEGLQEVPNPDAQVVSYVAMLAIAVCLAGLFAHLISKLSKK